jgi:Fe-S cluster biogenesis protein NfuA
MNTPETQNSIARVVNEVLAPLVARDRGTITFVRVIDGVAEVKLGGACRGCPGQMYTLQGVVLPALSRVDATIREVRCVS